MWNLQLHTERFWLPLVKKGINITVADWVTCSDADGKIIPGHLTNGQQCLSRAATQCGVWLTKSDRTGWSLLTLKHVSFCNFLRGLFFVVFFKLLYKYIEGKSCCKIDSCWYGDFGFGFLFVFSLFFKKIEYLFFLH